MRNAGFAVIVAAAIVAGVVSAVPSPSSAPRPPATPIHRALPSGATVDFDLVLRLRTGALARYERELFDPAAPGYGQHVTPEVFGRRFGISSAALSRLEQALPRLGLEVLDRYPQRTSLHVRGTAAAVSRLFQVRMATFEHRGHTVIEPDRDPIIPVALRSSVLAVAGLDTTMVATKDDLPEAASGALRPLDARTAYRVSPLYGTDSGSIDGKGTTIALLSIDRFSLDHYTKFSKAFGLPTTPVPKVIVASVGDDESSDETDLDSEVIHSIAPKAQIIDYEIDFVYLADAINRIVRDHKATIVTGSFGMCDAIESINGYKVPQSFRLAVENALRAAAASGVTFFFSTGDAGAYDCQRSHPEHNNLTVHFPSDAPYTVAVGGTVLDAAPDGSYEGETGWQDIASNGGSGGGVNPYDKAPPWQSAVQIRGISTGNRQTPDVSAAGGSGSPWWVYDGNASSGWAQMYGTSASTPFWAASMLLVQQYMAKQGAGPLCFAAPLLYAVAGLSWRYPPFHDVASGGNRYYNAVKGWDFATGWGSPDVYNLATAIVAYRQKHPLRGGGSACRSVVP